MYNTKLLQVYRRDERLLQNCMKKVNNNYTITNNIKPNDLWKIEKEFLSIFEQELHISESGINRTEFNDLFYLLQTLYSKNNQKLIIADVGCYVGLSTSLFSLQSKLTGGKVFAIDNFVGDRSAPMIYRSHKEADIKTILEKNLEYLDTKNYVTIIKEDSEKITTQFADNYFDLVFIDANHQYEAVKKDIEAWLPKVKKNGILCGHDCEILIKNGVEDFYEKWGEHDFIGLHLGVIRAVSELLPNATLIEKLPYNKYEPQRIWYIKK